MPTRTLLAATATSTIEAPLVVPEGPGPWPLVVFYIDALGLRPAMTAMAERLAAAGYAVLLPNIFAGVAPFEPLDVRTAFSVASEWARLRSLVEQVQPAAVLAETRALLQALAGDPQIDATRVGVVGYCLGGKLAFLAASALPDTIAAAAVIHAGGLVTDAPDSPHRQAASIRGALYVGVADQDRHLTPEHQQALRAALDAAGVRSRMELYPGALHGFAVSDFPIYDEEAAERHWTRLLALFAEHLPAPQVARP